MSFAVIGLGKTGLSVARFLARENQSFIVMDSRENPPELTHFQHEFPTIPLYLGNFNLEILKQVECIVLSPGVDPSIFLSQFGAEKIFSDIDLFAKSAKAPIIGITGTNAKGTVTTLLSDMMIASGFNVSVGGNIGVPALDLLTQPVPDYYVLELSSFQLELSHLLPFIASTILNITPDHLDRHANMENYIKAKQKIYLNTKYAICNREDNNTVPQFPMKNTHSFGLSTSQNINEIDPSLIFSLNIKGKHNVLNTLAALSLGQAIDLPLDNMLTAIKNFKGLEHRCEWLGKKKDLDWINDSKGTNIGATLAALEGFGSELQQNQKIILILGGLSKNQDFTLLQNAVNKYTREIILMGQDALLIHQALKKGILAESLFEAVTLVLQNTHKNDVVLFSPACASFDMFKNFEDRGNQFKLLVKAL
jgi:UDP-N-acetylmuramoylalanine--D-glutamate ligase